MAVCMAAGLHAQDKKAAKGKDAAEAPTDNDQSSAPPAGLQWANRDMTYHGQNYDIMDSAYYPKYRLKQYKRYMDHLEAFPPKPRNMWEVGVGGGTYNVIGNIPTVMLWQKGGAGGVSFNVRKSIGYVFSMRLQYIYGVAKNLDRQLVQSYDMPYISPLTHGYTPQQLATPTDTVNPIYRSTRMESSMLNMDFMFNLGNISFHKARNKMSFFGYFGTGGIGYKTRVDALNNDKFVPYNFGNMVQAGSEKEKAIRKDILKAMDKKYESPAPNTGTKTILDKKTLTFAPSVGVGAQYKINKQFNVQVEERFAFPMDAYLDGTTQSAAGGKGRVHDALNYFSVSINYNVKYKKSVEPLYWMNPLDHAYNELSYPRHMILPNPVLPDKDEDGVTDQFDKCPKTPAGLKVDARGCPLDTDHDGVPDYKDKQLITPTECQPVDADGVGHCPCPDGCKDMVSNDKGGDRRNPCSSIGACTLMFPDNSNKINKGIEIQLTTLAAQMQANPLCKVVITGGGSGSKIKEQRSWEHVNAIIEYMGDKHSVTRDRFIFKYGESENENIVQCRPADVDEQGDSNVPPPHPNLK